MHSRKPAGGKPGGLDTGGLVYFSTSKPYKSKRLIISVTKSKLRIMRPFCKINGHQGRLAQAAVFCYLVGWHLRELSLSAPRQ